jgi:hypothetical protein
VASSQRLHRDQVEDGRVDATGYVGPFYPKIDVFIVLGPRGNLVFSLLLGLINRTVEGWGYLPLLVTPRFQEDETEASIRVHRMFKSHIW